MATIKRHRFRDRPNEFRLRESQGNRLCACRQERNPAWGKGNILQQLVPALRCGFHLMAMSRSPDYSRPVKSKKHFSGNSKVGFALGAVLLAALTNGAGSADGHGIGMTLTPPKVVVQDDYVQYRIYFLFLILGICLLVSGGVMLKHLPDYRRRAGTGEIQRSKSLPSFKTRRRAAIGFLVGGVLFVVGWGLHGF